MILESMGFTKDVELAPSLDGAPMMLPEEDDDEDDSDDDDAPDERTNMMAMEDMEMVGHDARRMSVGDHHEQENTYHPHHHHHEMDTMDV